MGNNKSKTVNITTEPSASNKEEVVVGAGKVVAVEDSDHIKPQQTNGNAGKENADTNKVRLDWVINVTESHFFV